MADKPKLQTVAQRAGVSTATASQALRGIGRISEKTRERVIQAAAELHYVPDGRAASMRSGQNREIGFVIDRMANPFNAEVISGVSDMLEIEGFLVTVLDGHDDTEYHKRHIEAFIRNGRGGLLWVPASGTPKQLLDMLSVQSIPTVTFMHKPKDSGFDHVGIRNVEATATATHHLVELGHERIAFFGGSGAPAVRRERIAGYKQALAEAGLGDPLIWDCAETKPAAMAAMNALRHGHPDVTAVVCYGDVVALGACLALRRAGLMPGAEMSVVGFDGIEDAALATPALTTMAVSPYKLGENLAHVLLERLGDPTRPHMVSELPAELVVRKTTNPPLD